VELFVRYYDKVERARAKAAAAEEAELEEGDEEEEKAEARLARLMDAGLYVLQRVSVILGFVWSRSVEGQARVLKRMKMEGRDVGQIAEILREFARSLGEDAEGAVAEGGGAAKQRRRLRFWAAHLETAAAPLKYEGGEEEEEEEEEGEEEEGEGGERNGGSKKEKEKGEDEDGDVVMDELAKEA
jgi:hypothetical protein